MKDFAGSTVELANEDLGAQTEATEQGILDDLEQRVPDEVAVDEEDQPEFEGDDEDPEDEDEEFDDEDEDSEDEDETDDDEDEGTREVLRDSNETLGLSL